MVVILNRNEMFNRYKKGHTHEYYREFGGNNDRSHKLKGLIKCKLIHTVGESLIVPDLIFLDVKGDNFKWIQPLSFFGCRIAITDQENLQCSIIVDVSCKQTIELKFSNHDFVRGFDDYSELYECEILGPKAINNYATGTGNFKNYFDPYIRLYHHTTASAKESITKSGHFFDSRGNFAGTKELISIGYLYLTCLDKIDNEADLQQISMSSNKYIYLQTDGDVHIRKLPVLHRQTKELEAVIALDINVQAIASEHLHRHLHGATYYAICNPFIYRVGLEPKKGINFENFIIEQENTKKADYIVAGDCRTIKGLVAPYDEENTEYIYKIEKISITGCSNSLEFWLKNQNSDQFTDKHIKFTEFKK